MSSKLFFIFNVPLIVSPILKSSPLLGSLMLTPIELFFEEHTSASENFGGSFVFPTSIVIVCESDRPVESRAVNLTL